MCVFPGAEPKVLHVLDRYATWIKRQLLIERRYLLTHTYLLIPTYTATKKNGSLHSSFEVSVN